MDWKKEIRDMANGAMGNAINHWSYLDWISHIEQILASRAELIRKQKLLEVATNSETLMWKQRINKYIEDSAQIVLSGKTDGK